MSIKILVVEDEKSIANRIIRLTKEILGPKLGSIDLSPNVDSAINFLDEHSIDLLFLDLNLSGKDGFEILKHFLAKPFETIIISAYRDKAIEAFEYGVSDFVPKPFDKKRLEQAIARVEDSNKLTEHKTKNLIIKKQGKIVLIPVSQVRYIQGANIYSEIHLEDSRKELSDKSLETLHKILPENFQRVHKSYIADMQKAQELLILPGSKYVLKMKDGTEIPVGRTKYKQIKSNYFS